MNKILPHAFPSAIIARKKPVLKKLQRVAVNRTMRNGLQYRFHSQATQFSQKRGLVGKALFIWFMFFTGLYCFFLGALLIFLAFSWAGPVMGITGGLLLLAGFWFDGAILAHVFRLLKKPEKNDEKKMRKNDKWT